MRPRIVIRHYRGVRHDVDLVEIRDWRMADGQQALVEVSTAGNVNITPAVAPVPAWIAAQQ